VDTELRFLAGLAIDESARLIRATHRERNGRGYSLVSLLIQACERVSIEASSIAGQVPLADPAVGPSLERELYRLLDELKLVHLFLGMYAGDFGRNDLPVGLVHMVDALVRDLLPRGADPIIHLSPENMYSTLGVVEAAKQLWRLTPPPDPHPVGFNLPALNPENAMLAPILAHEVGHTAWRQGLDAQLNATADLTAASAHLRSAVVPGGPSAQHLAELFDSWRQELLCDALAAVLTGPSFLFASAVFLPVTTGPLMSRVMCCCLIWTSFCRIKSRKSLSGPKKY